MKKVNLSSIIVVFFILALSCEKEPYELDKQVHYEDNKIEHFISNSHLNFIQKESGLYFLDVEKGNGLSPVDGDFVNYEYNIWLLDSTLTFTTDSALAYRHQIYDSLKLYGTDKRRVGRMTMGESEALTLMKENGRSTIIVPFNLGYGEYSKLEKIPPYSTLLVDLYLKEVIKDPVEHEKLLLAEFISKNPEYEKITEGVYYHRKSNGNDKLVTGNPKVYMDMSLLDGRHISSTASVLSSEILNELSGFKLGLSMMTEHEQGTFIISSEWAFGDKENLLIPPYSTIIIDLKVLDVY